jgi:hypothetical protein
MRGEWLGEDRMALCTIESDPAVFPNTPPAEINKAF